MRVCVDTHTRVCIYCVVLCLSQVAEANTKTRPLKDKGGLKPNPASVNHTSLSPHDTSTSQCSPICQVALMQKLLKQ